MKPGRPSVADERREQILDAVVRCILQYGVAGTTRARIAEEAGMKPPAVHHFGGTRTQVVQAGIESATKTVRRRLDRLVHGQATAEGRLEAALAAFFGGGRVDAELNQLIDELVAYAYLDEPTRDAVQRMYGGFLEELGGLIRDVHPAAKDEALADAALAVLALGHAASTFAGLGIEPEARARMRSSAERIIRSLS